MRTVGSLLHDERLKQGLTLEMLSVDTRISLRNLEAIEADQLGHFTSPFFYKSFVKQFAKALQMDGADLANLLESQATAIPPPPVPGEDMRPHPKVPALRQAGKRSVARWAVQAASLLIVLIGCSGVYAWWESARGAAPTTSLPTKASPAPNRSLPPATPAVKSQDTANAVPDSPSTASKPDSSAPQSEVAARPDANPTGTIHLELAAVERSWVSVVSDGKSIFSGILDPEQTKVFDGRQTARIKAGNAGGVHIVFNGRVIGALGPRGQVRTAVFTPDNFEIVDPASHFEFTKVSRVTE